MEPLRIHHPIFSPIHCIATPSNCTNADKLANDVYVEAADIGDIAVFGLAGAYGLTMSNKEFLSHARPPEIVL